MTGLRLRRARTADADLIADLHTASWRTAYRGLVLDRFLDTGLAARRRRHWRATMAKARPRDIVLLAEDRQGVAGFISVWVRRGSPAFIDNLHAHPAHKRRGVGSFLMREAARRLTAIGQRRAYLWVLDNNLAARRFYAAIGGARVLREFEMFGNARVSHSRILWRDVFTLARLT